MSGSHLPLLACVVVLTAAVCQLSRRQAGQMLATFGVGMDEVHAALTLFTRATDAETDLKVLRCWRF